MLALIDRLFKSFTFTFFYAVVSNSIELPENPIVSFGRNMESFLSVDDVIWILYYSDVTQESRVNALSFSDSPPIIHIEVYNENGQLLEEFDTTISNLLIPSGFTYFRLTQTTETHRSGVFEFGVSMAGRIPASTQGSVYAGFILDSCSQQGIFRAEINMASQFTLSHLNGEFRISRINQGSYIRTISAKGFENLMGEVQILEKSFIVETLELEPVVGCDADMELVNTEASDTVRYDGSQGRLSIDSVQSGNVVYQTTLINQGSGNNFEFAIETLNELIDFENQAAASYLNETGELFMPQVQAFGQFYDVVMQHNGDFVFRLKSAEIIIP